MSAKPKPLSELEMRQVTGGISRNIQQPANAARFLNQLLTDLNSVLTRITELERQVEELRPKDSGKVPQKSDKKPLSPIDSI